MIQRDIIIVGDKGMGLPTAGEATVVVDQE